MAVAAGGYGADDFTVMPNRLITARIGICSGDGKCDEPHATGALLVVGGCSQNGSTCTFLNDTWTWDGTNWTQQSPPVSPSPRQAVAMT